MRWVILSCCVLVGCDSPGIGYSAAEVTRVQVGDSMFSLRRSGDVVQAIRTNFLRQPDMNLVGRDAEVAIERTYHCPVTKMRGDVALMVAHLNCDRSVKPNEWAKWIRPRRSQASCLGDIIARSSGSGYVVDVTCF
jgi:hypothetical protein